MKNKIIFVLIAFISLALLSAGVLFFVNGQVYDGFIFSGSAVIALIINLVVYRHGIKGAFGAIGEGVDKPFK